MKRSQDHNSSMQIAAKKTRVSHQTLTLSSRATTKDPVSYSLITTATKRKRIPSDQSLPSVSKKTRSSPTTAQPSRVGCGKKRRRCVTILAHTHPVHYHAPNPTARFVTKLEGMSGSADSLKELPISADQLLHRVSTGDSAAVQECIERFGGLVWSLARRSGLPERELEDAVHEIFTELWHNGYKYDANIASEAAFVAIIARRRLIDRRRRISRRPVSSELTELNGGGTSAEESAHTGAAVSEDAAAAVKALETLSTDQQRVLRLSVYEGLSHELISRSTGLPLGTVKTHARRGLIRLRELLSSNPNSEISKGGES